MKKFLLAFIAVIGFYTVHAQTDSLLQVNVLSKKINDSTYNFIANISVTKGWYLYGLNKNIDGLEPFKFVFNSQNIKPKNEISFNQQSKNIFDETFSSKVNVYEGTVIAQQQFVIGGTIPSNLKVDVSANVGKQGAFQPVEQNLSVALEGGVNNSDEKAIKISSVNIHQPIASCGGGTSNKDSSLFMVFLLGFLGGLIALLTPCVFPMIPVTVSFFTKRSSNHSQAIRNGLLYGLFILLIYVLSSLPFHLLGNVQPEIFNNISTNPWLNIAFFIIFIIFAISFFGYFEITLPGSIANKADSKSGLGSTGGIFFMALTLVIVSFSCTGPILGSLLVSSLSGGAWQLTAGLTGFGLALALPFALFAIFPHWLQSLPKSGSWLDVVKKILAFVEVALAFKFLSNADLVMHWGILKRETFIGIWILVSFSLMLYLFGIIRLPHDEKGMKISFGRKTIGIVALLFTLYLIPEMFNKKISFFFLKGNPESYDLQLLSGFPPPLNYSIYTTSTETLQANVMNDYNKALQLAKEQHKPLLIDFTGWACVNCRKMEENVWTDPEVYKMIKDKFILVSLYVDDKQQLPIDKQFTYTTKDGTKKDIVTIGDKWATFQSENFNQVTQPLYVILNNNQQLVNVPVGYTPNAKQYLQWLQCGLENN